MKLTKKQVDLIEEMIEIRIWESKQDDLSAIELHDYLEGVKLIKKQLVEEDYKEFIE